MRRPHAPGRAEFPPAVIAVPALAGLVLLVLPLAGLAWRAPWSRLVAELAAPEARSALWLSLGCSVAALAVSALLGLPLAWALARVRLPGRSLVRALTVLPMVLPPVVGGVALLSVFGRRALVGAWLDRTLGVTLPFSPAGAVLAEVFVAMPFLVVASEAGIRQLDHRYEEAAATLGAGRWLTFRKVTLPMLGPSLGAGAVLCWARALGEFGATITFAGNFPGRTQTLPLAVYLALERGSDGAFALSLVLLATCLAVLVALRGHWWPAR